MKIKRIVAVLFLLVVISSTGCAVGAGMIAGGAMGSLVGSSLEGGKTDTSSSCPSCVRLPNGMTRDQYAQQLREQRMRELEAR